jgi:hypothetical protein
MFDFDIRASMSAMDRLALRAAYKRHALSEAIKDLLMVPSAGGIELLKRQLYGRGGTITAATNASPSVLTFATPAFPPPAGSLVTITGAIGNTNINTTAIIYNISGATASIATVNAGTGVTTPINGNGAFSGTCVWSLGGVEAVALKLYSNNITPAEADVAGTYTELANSNGYTTGGFTLNSQSATTAWTTPATVGAGGTGAWGTGLGTGSTNVPEATYPQQTWTWTGNMTAYGYYVVGSTSTTIAWSERFANPPKNFANADTLNFTPRLGTTHA